MRTDTGLNAVTLPATLPNTAILCWPHAGSPPAFLLPNGKLSTDLEATVVHALVHMPVAAVVNLCEVIRAPGRVRECHIRLDHRHPLHDPDECSPTFDLSITYAEAQ